MTPLVASRRIAGDVREPLDASGERDPRVGQDERDRHAPRRGAVTQLERRVIEARHPHALLGQALEVDVRDDHLLGGCESLRLGEELAVLVNHPVAVPRQIRRRLP